MCHLQSFSYILAGDIVLKTFRSISEGTLHVFQMAEDEQVTYQKKWRNLENIIIQEKKKTCTRTLWLLGDVSFNIKKKINNPNIKFSWKHIKNKLKESEMQLCSPSESLMWHQSWISEPDREDFENSGMTEHKTNLCGSGTCHS